MLYITLTIFIFKIKLGQQFVSCIKPTEKIAKKITFKV